MKRLKLEVDGKEYTVLAQKLQGTLWLHHKGKTFAYAPAGAERKGRHQAGTVSPGVITAPMPGKVIKVYFEPGVEVESGHSIITMEAMKMEYNLASDISGVLTEVQCQEGDQVALGQTLARVTKEES